MRLRTLVVAVAALLLAAGAMAPAGAASRAGVSIHTSTHSVIKGGSVTLKARGHHTASGTHILFQRHVGGHWVKGSPWRSRRGGKITYRFPDAGAFQYRAAVALASGRVIAHSRITTIHVLKPKPKPKPKPTKPAAPAKHACTQTSSGSCIQGGEFCPQASYGQTGWDANGTPWVCKGDTTHPHWEH